MPLEWQPCADQDALRRRAKLLHDIREFMNEERVLEVETPILNPSAVPDPSIHSLSVESCVTRQKYYLGTSPEFYMKRLLAVDVGAIFQIVRVFRDDPISPIHQAEFSMLEWYIPGFDHQQLMDQLQRLLQKLGLDRAEAVSYKKAFADVYQVDPHTADIQELKNLAKKHGLHDSEIDRASLLDFLFSHSVSATLGHERPTLLYDYPACQAALAKLRPGNPDLAERFELFIQGVEIANGFNELTDAIEQRKRFIAENQVRQQRGLDLVPLDEPFLAALEHGLPACAGVALGLDRLLMILSGKKNISELMTFPIEDE